MPRLVALQAEWRHRPPANWLLAGALKYRPPELAAPRQPTVDEIKSAFPNGRL